MLIWRRPGEEEAQAQEPRRWWKRLRVRRGELPEPQTGSPEGFAACSVAFSVIPMLLAFAVTQVLTREIADS